MGWEAPWPRGPARVLTQAQNLLRRLGGPFELEKQGVGRAGALLKRLPQAVESGALELSPSFHRKTWRLWFSRPE